MRFKFTSKTILNIIFFFSVPFSLLFISKIWTLIMKINVTLHGETYINGFPFSKGLGFRLKHQPAVRTASSPVRWKHQTVRTTLTPVRWRHQAVRTAWSSVLQWHPFELDFRFFLSKDILGDKLRYSFKKFHLFERSFNSVFFKICSTLFAQVYRL